MDTEEFSQAFRASTEGSLTARSMLGSDDRDTSSVVGGPSSRFDLTWDEIEAINSVPAELHYENEAAVAIRGGSDLGDDYNDNHGYHSSISGDSYPPPHPQSPESLPRTAFSGSYRSASHTSTAPTSLPDTHSEAETVIKVAKRKQPRLIADCDLSTNDKKMAAMVYTACKHRNMNKLRRLIAEDAPLDALDPESGKTPLIYCIINREYLACKLLIEGGADTNKCGEHRFRDTDPDKDPFEAIFNKRMSPIGAAIHTEDRFIVALLTQNGADLNPPDAAEKDNPLCTAVGLPNQELTEMLVLNGADVNLRNALRICIRKGTENMARFLLQNGADPLTHDEDDVKHEASLLFDALARKDAKFVELLLEYGLDEEVHTPNKMGTQPLLAAVLADDMERCRVLIEYGARAQVTTELVQTLVQKK